MSAVGSGTRVAAATQTTATGRPRLAFDFMLGDAPHLVDELLQPFLMLRSLPERVLEGVDFGLVEAEVPVVVVRKADFLFGMLLRNDA